MPQPNFEGARQYAMDRLEHELSPSLTYHAISHTRDDVLPAAERLAILEEVQPEELLLLRTAACYHDIGFIVQYKTNEAIGVRIAVEALPGFGYSQAQVKIIKGMILATRIPQSPHTKLEEIIADADLDSLGREDFWKLGAALRCEQATFMTPVSDCEWYTGQLQFLQAHRYFTKSAQSLRDRIKRQHIVELLSRLKKTE